MASMRRIGNPSLRIVSMWYLSYWMNNACKFTLAMTLIALAFIVTYASSATLFSSHDVKLILAWGGSVNAILLAGAALLPRSKRLANALLALTALVSIGTAYIIHTDIYFGSKALTLLLCVGFWAALFVAFSVADRGRWGGATLLGGAVAGLVLAASQVPTAGAGPVRGDESNIRDLRFRETPNLYFVSFDGMAPRALLSKYMHLETTDFHELFEQEFRRFPNLFADAIYTMHSLNSILSLDETHYRSQRSALAKRGEDPIPHLMSGQHPSPLHSILRKNGYETSMISENRYFGNRKGPWVDHYFWQEGSICDFLDSRIRGLAFWGHCAWQGDGWEQTLLRRSLSVDQILKLSGREGPQFGMMHIFTPSHTGKGFRYDDPAQLEAMRAAYLRGSNLAAGYLQRIVRHLRQNDPNGILLVYGEHGPLLSRQAWGRWREDDLEFVVQDSYGILGGVYPPDACAAYFDEPVAQGQMFILDAVHALLACLSGESALIGPRARSTGWHGVLPESLDFARFSYE